jgi:hypothetical protein
LRIEGIIYVKKSEDMSNILAPALTIIFWPELSQAGGGDGFWSSVCKRERTIHCNYDK